MYIIEDEMGDLSISIWVWEWGVMGVCRWSWIAWIGLMDVVLVLG